MIIGKSSWKQASKGDIALSLEWVNDEPAMILFPKQPRAGQTKAYVICLSSAYKYNDLAYLAQQSAIAAEYMGMDVNRTSINNISDIILNYLIDLVEMPPKAMVHKTETREVGDMSIIVNGKTVTEKAMSVDVETGAVV